MKYFKYIIAITLIASGVGYFKFIKIPDVKTVKAIKGDAVETIYATGTVESTAMVPIRSKVTARILDILALEGQNIEKGQLIAKLDSAEITAKLTELSALVDFHKLELDRAESLLKQGAGSIQLRDKARSTYLNSEAILLGTKIELAEYKITSPSNCKVIQQDGEIGELITPEYELFWLDCSGKYRITADVDEEDINYVKVGQKVLLKYEGDLKSVYEGAVSSVTPRGDSVSRAFRVRIDIKQDLPFMLGMSTEANIITGIKNNQVLIPATALVNEAVWVVNKENKLEKHTLKLGIVNENKAEVISGLKVGEIIVSQPQSWLKIGQKVNSIVDKSGRKK